MKVIGAVFGLLLLAWFSVMAAAATMALQKKKEAPAPSDESSDEIELTAIFDSVDFKSTASAFRGGKVDFRFGGGSLDLRGATLDPAGAVLQTTAVFGGGQILVPETWVVETHVSGVGGVGDSRPSAPETASDGAPTLVIEGTAMFGGFGIMSTDPRPEREAEAVAV